MARLTRTFREMLGQLSRGDLARHLDSQLKEALTALSDAPENEKTKVKLTLELEMTAELGRVDITGNSKLKLPDTKKFMRTPFFLVDGQLSTDHPSQLGMFPAPVRTVEHDDDEADTARAEAR